MEIGARIKQARLEKGLSQRELCGQVITRNMLSLIESGRARPGMDTLAYLAGQLEKPISYFLEEQAVTSPNQKIMAQARQQYAAGQYRQAVLTLEAYRENDPVFDAERFLLETLALMQMAQQAVRNNKPGYALSLLDKASAAADNTPYATAELARQRLLLSYAADPAGAVRLASGLPDMDEELLLRASAALDAGDAPRCGQLLDAAQSRSPRWWLLRGQAAMAQKEYAQAAQSLHRAEADFPQQTAPALEQCYRELGDYRRAYEYACRQREIPSL